MANTGPQAHGSFAAGKRGNSDLMPNDFRRYFARAAVLATALFSPFGMFASGSEQAISVLSVAITSYTLGRQVGDLFAPLVSAIRSEPSATRKTVDVRQQAAAATAAMLRFNGEPSANGSSCFERRPWTDGESGERWPQLVKGAAAEEI
jgi:hypothetical protein